MPRNACKAVDRPQITRQEMKVLDREQVNTLLRAAKGNRMKALYTLAVTTGLRVSELAGLGWDAVDFNGAKLKGNFNE